MCNHTDNANYSVLIIIPLTNMRRVSVNITKKRKDAKISSTKHKMSFHKRRQEEEKLEDAVD